MKYIVIIADGMADEPIEQLGGKTPMEVAKTPVMDLLAKAGTLGTVCNVPKGMKPGSDVANLSVVGYDPHKVYTGRSPLEALSVGVPMEETDVAFRCNLVTLDDAQPFAAKTILDHSSGEISTEDADILMDAVRKAFNSEELSFFTGTSYRHIMIWKNGQVLSMEQPHDHLGEMIGDYLPKEERFRQMMEKSYGILDKHPLNQKRAAEGLNKANSVWLWGAGTKPMLGSFSEKTGLSGAMISAVDLLKGIAVGAQMTVIDVPGANGSLHTNYEGKAEAALKALLQDGNDIAFIHIEAPDEMGHQGSVERKVQAIEYIDSRVVKTVKERMDASGEHYRLLILPDHPTPIRCRTHTADPVPYVLYDSQMLNNNDITFNEKHAETTGNYEPNGYRLIEKLIANGGN